MYVKEIKRTEISLSEKEIDALKTAAKILHDITCDVGVDFWINVKNSNENVSRVEMECAAGVLSFLVRHPITEYQDC